VNRRDRRWMDDAECARRTLADPLVYPPLLWDGDGTEDDAVAAAVVCGVCPVALVCQMYGRMYGDHDTIRAGRFHGGRGPEIRIPQAVAS
jgi:hypothetical protein